MSLDWISLSLILLCVLMGCIYCWYLTRRPKGAPPGPRGLPYFGYAPFLDSAPLMHLAELSKKYESNITSMYLGPHFTVILSDSKAVHAAFVDQDEMFKDRPDHRFVTEYHVTDGDENTTAKKRQRAGSLHDFINEGAQELATTKMEDLIQLEISDMIKAITDQAGVPFDFQKLVVHTASQILGRHFFGERWSTQRNSQLRLQWMERFQWLKEKWDRPKPCVAGPRVVKRRESYEHVPIQELVDLFASLSPERDALDRTRLPCNDVDDFFAIASAAVHGGGQSTDASLSWAILFMLYNPKMQRRIQFELGAEIPENQLVSYYHKDILPYTMGAVYESFRLGSHSVLGVPHCNSAEMELLGYRIPKGSVFTINAWACHRDPKDWKYPEQFNPENWINKDGNFHIPNGFMAFSAGSRACPGQELAPMIVFVMFANLLKKFNFINPDDQQLPCLQKHAASVVSTFPNPFKVKAIPRF